jgi:hypothetical protein
VSRVIVAIVAAVTIHLAPAHHHRIVHHHRHRPVAPWLYTKRLERSLYGWTGAEWIATDELVDRESGWNYCAHYPSTTDCGYMGTNACGIPQRDPCPAEWRGHLERWHRQVLWMLRYIRRNYGDPINAAYHESHGGY